MFAPLAAVLLALAALGFFLLARDGARRGPARAPRSAMARRRAGPRRAPDRRCTRTSTRCGASSTLPFALAAGGVDDAGVRRCSRCSCVVGAFAYPLHAADPALALAVLLWPERRPAARRCGAGGWSPLGAARARPAARRRREGGRRRSAPVVDPTRVAAHVGRRPRRASSPSTSSSRCRRRSRSSCSAPLLARRDRAGSCAASRARSRSALGGVLAVRRRSPRSWFRPRDFGWYFHFKALAFVGPLARAARGGRRLAAARAARGSPLLACSSCSRVQGARDEIVDRRSTRRRGRSTALREVDALLPAGRVGAPRHGPGRRSCGSRTSSPASRCARSVPLLDTSYPHVPVSRKADYVLVDHRDTPRPREAAGPPVWRGEWFSLYRLRAGRAGRRPLLPACRADDQADLTTQDGVVGRRRATSARPPAASRDLRLDEPLGLLVVHVDRRGLEVQRDHAAQDAPPRTAPIGQRPGVSERLERGAHRLLGALGRVARDARAPRSRSASRSSASSSASATSSASTAGSRSSASSAASPATSGTPPDGRATTGTPKWNASSSGMQKPSCSDSETKTPAVAVAVGELARRRARARTSPRRARALGQLRAARARYARVERLADERRAARRAAGGGAAARRTRISSSWRLCGARRPTKSSVGGSARPLGAGAPRRAGSKRIGMTDVGAELGRVVRRHAGDDVGARGELAAAARRPSAHWIGDHRLVVPEPARRRDVVGEQQRRGSAGRGPSASFGA